MSKGLEALDNLLHLDSYGEDRKEYMQELGDVIEKALKALEFIDKRFGSFILTVIEDDLRTSKEERDLLKEVLL